MTSPTTRADFLGGEFGVEFERLHREKQAAVDGLHAVAHIGQRAVHDGGKGVGEVTLGQGFAQGFVEDVLRRRGGWGGFGGRTGHLVAIFGFSESGISSIESGLRE